eukprot:scaffold7969_cov60-Phaeocystis_antarctica.AAC.1
MCPSPPRGAQTAPGRALANLCIWGPGGQIYRCAAGRHLRAPAGGSGPFLALMISTGAGPYALSAG